MQVRVSLCRSAPQEREANKGKNRKRETKGKKQIIKGRAILNALHPKGSSSDGKGKGQTLPGSSACPSPGIIAQMRPKEREANKKGRKGKKGEKQFVKRRAILNALHPKGSSSNGRDKRPDVTGVKKKRPKETTLKVTDATEEVKSRSLWCRTCTDGKKPDMQVRRSDEVASLGRLLSKSDGRKSVSGRRRGSVDVLIGALLLLLLLFHALKAVARNLSNGVDGIVWHLRLRGVVRNSAVNERTICMFLSLTNGLVGCGHVSANTLLVDPSLASRVG